MDCKILVNPQGLLDEEGGNRVIRGGGCLNNGRTGTDRTSINGAISRRNVGLRLICNTRKEQ